MLVDAFHAALEDRIVAFNRVGGDLAANVFLGAVVHGVMAHEVRAKLAVPAAFVRVDDALASKT